MVVFGGPYRALPTPTADSTLEKEAPIAYLRDSVDILDSIAKRELSRIQRQRHRLLQNSMPTLEATHRLSAEADVSRFSVLQLLHPVNIALQAMCPPNWTLSVGHAQYALAILEFKNTHVISRQEFDRATFNQGTTDEETQQNMDRKISELYRLDEEVEPSLLQGNAFWLAKQAAKYAEDCSDVAIFDGMAMFIFNYVYAKSEPHISRRQDWVRGTYFDEGGRGNQTTFRRVLFGFVARALKRRLLRLS
ncbi:uncharacterized protein N7459_004024 [Penicillium hispanicum]|uniref:uncharacterized protein n=1 Tax=Penicillium hispanicum TaxID=1080232 RepID=UPI00253FF291|nr:uncharacterized protein N7459_004024 [Penicillium hispanicum]KAJ5584224.1 hypothetical protein N7459_004024 [Penicillium hispanicum]